MKHQLQPNMVVKETTVAQRIEIHDACVNAGIECEPTDTFFNFELWPWIWVGEDSDIWSIIDKHLGAYTYISAEEFLLRAKGEWVGK